MVIKRYTQTLDSKKKKKKKKMWTDARRPVPRLWIRSAEERGERRYENRNTTTTDSKTLLGFSDFIPTNSAADWATGANWSSDGGGVVVVVCVCVGGMKPFQN